MLQANVQSDPIVEILRLAYRRGLALREAQLQGTVQTASSIDETESSTHVDSQPEEEKDQI